MYSKVYWIISDYSGARKPKSINWTKNNSYIFDFIYYFPPCWISELEQLCYYPLTALKSIVIGFISYSHSACSYAANPVRINPIFMSIIFHHYKQLTRIAKQIETTQKDRPWALLLLWFSFKNFKKKLVGITPKYEELWQTWLQLVYLGVLSS
jgi:hypothetical protein